MQDFNYLSSNDFEITLELGCNKYTKESEIEKEWNRNKNALINLIWQACINYLYIIFNIYSCNINKYLLINNNNFSLLYIITYPQIAHAFTQTII